MPDRGKPRLPWLLLLVAVSAVLPSSAIYNGNDIKSIVKNVIENNPVFASFPKPPDYPTGKQVAGLVLISQQDYANGNTNIQLYPAPTRRNINNRYPVQPGPRVRVNYMVARPDTPNEARQRPREHAERKLLVNSGQLLQKFESQFGRPAMALLYTWATPCPRCTNALLAAKRLLDQKYPQARIPITVVYSADRAWQQSGMTPEINRENRQRLRNAGFTVIDINAPSYGGQGGGGSGGGGLSGGWPLLSSGGGGGGQFFRHTSPLLRRHFSMNSNLRAGSYWNFLRNQRRQGQGGLGYTQPSTTNFGRFGTGSQTSGWGLLRNRFPQRPLTNTGRRTGSQTSGWGLLRNRFPQRPLTNTGRRTGSQTSGWGLLRNRFPQRPLTNTGRRPSLLPALKWTRPPRG